MLICHQVSVMYVDIIALLHAQSMTLPSVFISFQQLYIINVVHKPRPTLTSVVTFILKSITTNSGEVTCVPRLPHTLTLCVHNYILNFRNSCCGFRSFLLHEPEGPKPLVTNFVTWIHSIQSTLTQKYFLKSPLNLFSRFHVSRLKHKLPNVIIGGLTFLWAYMSCFPLRVACPICCCLFEWTDLTVLV
jgi:hypothetical protein